MGRSRGAHDESVRGEDRAFGRGSGDGEDEGGVM